MKKLLLLVVFLIGCTGNSNKLYVYSQSQLKPTGETMDYVVKVNIPIEVHFVGSALDFPEGCLKDGIPAACTINGKVIYMVGTWVNVGLGLEAIDTDHDLIGHEFLEVLRKADPRILKPDLSSKLRRE